MFAKQGSKEPTTHGRLAAKNSTYAHTAIVKCRKDRVMCILKTDSGKRLKTHLMVGCLTSLLSNLCLSMT